MIAKKKTKKADLEGKRFAFFQIGLVVAGALTLAAFEYSGVRFNELAKTELETDAYANLMAEQPKEFIIETIINTGNRDYDLDSLSLLQLI